MRDHSLAGTRQPLDRTPGVQLVWMCWSTVVVVPTAATVRVRRCAPKTLHDRREPYQALTRRSLHRRRPNGPWRCRANAR